MPTFLSLTDVYDSMIKGEQPVPEVNTERQVLLEGMLEGVIRYRANAIVDSFITEEDVMAHSEFEEVMNISDPYQKQKALNQLIMDVIREKIEETTGQRESDNLRIQTAYDMKDVEFYRTSPQAIISKHQENKEEVD